MSRSKFKGWQAGSTASNRRTAGSFLLLLTLTASLSVSAAHDNSRPEAPTPSTVKTESATSALASRSKSLLLQGYNYTDHYIDSFSVNGQGGGNIFESSPTSGGGGSVCCVVWHPGSKLPVKIKVRWVAGYCTKLIRTKFGDYDERQNIYKEQDAWVSEAVREEASALEVHFYPDGRIEAAITKGDLPPRLKLQRDSNRNRPGVSQVIPRCPNEQK